MSEQQSGDVHFTPDFAERVLARADAIARRRRNWTAGVMGLAAAVVAVALSGVVPEKPRPIPAAPAVQVANADEFASASLAGTDPLQWMFPDAQAVAEFSGRYANASSGGAERRQQLLFADDTESVREP
jgi:hypothetical protein